jgi:hypothetical protein
MGFHYLVSVLVFQGINRFLEKVPGNRRYCDSKRHYDRCFERYIAFEAGDILIDFPEKPDRRVHGTAVKMVVYEIVVQVQGHS